MFGRLIKYSNWLAKITYYVGGFTCAIIEGIEYLFSFFAHEGVRMTEAQYQAKLIKKLEHMFLGCEVFKNDPQHRQGILDLTVLYGRCWAMLEVKAHATAPRRPNQEYYVDKFNGMGFAAFIYPENEKVVLRALQEAFASHGATCVSQSKHVPLDQLRRD